MSFRDFFKCFKKERYHRCCDVMMARHENKGPLDYPRFTLCACENTYVGYGFCGQINFAICSKCKEIAKKHKCFVKCKEPKYCNDCFLKYNEHCKECDGLGYYEVTYNGYGFKQVVYENECLACSGRGCIRKSEDKKGV